MATSKAHFDSAIVRDSVINLQEFLHERGYTLAGTPVAGKPEGVDGIWGGSTNDAFTAEMIKLQIAAHKAGIYESADIRYDDDHALAGQLKTLADNADGYVGGDSHKILNYLRDNPDALMQLPEQQRAFFGHAVVMRDLGATGVTVENNKTFTLHFTPQGAEARERFNAMRARVFEDNKDMPMPAANVTAPQPEVLAEPQPEAPAAVEPERVEPERVEQEIKPVESAPDIGIDITPPSAEEEPKSEESPAEVLPEAAAEAPETNAPGLYTNLVLDIVSQVPQVDANPDIRHDTIPGVDEEYPVQPDAVQDSAVPEAGPDAVVPTPPPRTVPQEPTTGEMLNEDALRSPVIVNRADAGMDHERESAPTAAAPEEKETPAAEPAVILQGAETVLPDTSVTEAPPDQPPKHERPPALPHDSDKAVIEEALRQSAGEVNGIPLSEVYREAARLSGTDKTLARAMESAPANPNSLDGLLWSMKLEPYKDLVMMVKNIADGQQNTGGLFDPDNLKPSQMDRLRLFLDSQDFKTRATGAQADMRLDAGSVGRDGAYVLDALKQHMIMSDTDVVQAIEAKFQSYNFNPDRPLRHPLPKPDTSPDGEGAQAAPQPVQEQNLRDFFSGYVDYHDGTAFSRNMMDSGIETDKVLGGYYAEKISPLSYRQKDPKNLYKDLSEEMKGASGVSDIEGRKVPYIQGHNAVLYRQALDDVYGKGNVNHDNLSAEQTATLIITAQMAGNDAAHLLADRGHPDSLERIMGYAKSWVEHNRDKLGIEAPEVSSSTADAERKVAQAPLTPGQTG